MTEKLRNLKLMANQIPKYPLDTEYEFYLGVDIAKQYRTYCISLNIINTRDDCQHQFSTSDNPYFFIILDFITIKDFKILRYVEQANGRLQYFFKGTPKTTFKGQFLFHLCQKMKKNYEFNIKFREYVEEGLKQYIKKYGSTKYHSAYFQEIREIPL